MDSIYASIGMMFYFFLSFLYIGETLYSQRNSCILNYLTNLNSLINCNLKNKKNKKNSLIRNKIHMQTIFKIFKNNVFLCQTLRIEFYES